MACPFVGFAFCAVLFLEPVDGDDVPRAIVRERAQPVEVWDIALKPVGQMNDGADPRCDRG